MMEAFDVGRIDEVIHGRLRLGIMAYLASVQTADFTEIKRRLGAADGNLSVQLRKLEDAGYVDIKKGFVGRKPLTRIQITQDGRKAFVAYLEAMGRLMNAFPDGLDDPA